MKIRPLHDRVVIKRMEEEKASPGGIIIPDSATEKPVKGEVVAVGNGKIQENGSVQALDVKVGDTVLFGKYSGTEVTIDSDELVVMKEDDIMAVID
ncbi:MAG: co-chaperone GroES [Gammaproteobacteria bacterium]|jgi:chaperonin GroES|nr:co-chaperone GroES [Gammaproteobacteria bacterium]MBT6754640.1 co-chaperone GroES [Gammaproteobacteria bacterium]MBT7523184.1 co-chaperone GroES [Gammaproteobacteria bacterium]MBT7814428.1 co-chaperone GroES [Gammaproteobacteria bacterium]MDA9896542.1 co-chaperone GroES [Gammaproteobacteria bacterium]|tara:strand:+ start:5328 stop:5615 length:288 start_codon:yes stop_codon:yes gene_type:complete